MKKKIWPKEIENLLDTIVESMKDAIIMCTEEFADFNKDDEVNYQGLEVAVYKSIETLRATTHATILKKLGPTIGMSLIQSIINRSEEDVSNVFFNDLKSRRDDFPPEVQKTIDLMDKIQKMRDGGEDVTEDLKKLLDRFKQFPPFNA